MKTFSQKPADVKRRWYVLDASEVSFGRLAAQAARLLIGKDKPSFTPHVDGGDYVVVINAEKMIITGDKQARKSYHFHSGYPGGLRTQRLSDIGNTAALEESVRGMLPANKLRKDRLNRLKIYAGGQHEHAAQKPEKLSLKGDK